MPWRFNPFTGNLDETDIPAFTGEVTLGSAASPSIFFTGDPNTGIYSPGTDQVAISTNGTGRLFVDASGRVGVGTTPSTVLHCSSTDAILTLQGTRGTGASATIGTGGANSQNLVITAGTNLYQRGATHLFQNVAGTTEYARIDSSGRLGLGTSDPNQSLEIYGSGTSTSQVAAITLRDGNSSFSRRWCISNGAGGNQADLFGKLVIGYGSTVSANPITGTAAVVIDSSGRVGVGTANPDANSQFHVVGTSYQPVYCNTTSAGGGGAIFLHSGTQALYVGTAGSSWLTGSSTADGLVRAEANLIFATNGNNQRAQIDSSGRLLVGTSSARSNLPFTFGNTAARLQVEGASEGTGAFAIIQNFDSATTALPAVFNLARSGATNIGSNTIVASGNRLGEVQFSGSDGTNFIQAAVIRGEVDGTPGANDMPGRLVFSTTADGASSPTERMRIDSSGRVGVGTTSPGAKLEVNGGEIYNVNGSITQYMSAGGGAAVIGTLSNTDWSLRTNNIERARIDSSGRLLVGTSTEQGGNLLQTFGNLALTRTASGNQINFYGTAIEFVNRNATARSMDFYVGASGGAPLASLSTAGVWTDASDISNKTNIQEIQYGIAAVKSLLPRQYDVISDGTHAVGFVAQEVQNVIPEVVNSTITEDGAEFLGLAYGQLTAVLTKALQEAIAKIETLEAKVAALETP